MGQQQILLITLSVIITGIAIIAGISMFRHQALISHRDDIISRMNDFMAQAVAYKIRPQSMGGGENSFWGYTPPGAESFDGHIGSPANDGVRLETDDVNYFIEWWPEGGYPQRIKIIASSKRYGEGNSWSNPRNARIVAYFDDDGKVIYSSNPNRNGFMITGNW